MSIVQDIAKNAVDLEKEIDWTSTLMSTFSPEEAFYARHRLNTLEASAKHYYKEYGHLYSRSQALKYASGMVIVDDLKRNLGGIIGDYTPPAKERDHKPLILAAAVVAAGVVFYLVTQFML